MGTSIERSTGQPDFVLKARAHGIEGERIDGMDVLTVRDAATRIIDRIRKTGDPYFLELTRIRFVGHGIGDDNTQGQKFYRSEKEVADWKERDPLQLCAPRSNPEGCSSEENAASIDEAVPAESRRSHHIRRISPEPPLDSLYENVFS